VGGRPRAQAAASGTASVARINMVYTPAEERGHGYASAVVSQLSQKQLDEGKKMVCLYADARNPVSNSIYRKLGYEFVGRSSLYVLDKRPEKQMAL
jgi:predicted GNAT family acetyltransferase